jgi:hypothetical protein
VVATVVLASVSGACAAEPEPPGTDPGELPEIRLEEVLRLGVVEGREGEEFGNVRGLTVTENAELWVIETRPPMLRRFSGDGTFLGTSGREGQGPGEFQEVRDLEPLPDGGVLVLDSRLARVSHFEPGGTFVEGWPLPSGIRYQLRRERSSGVLNVEARDFMALQRDFAGAGSQGGTQPSLSEPPTVWIRLDEAGQVMDTLRPPPASRTQAANIIYPVSDGEVLVPGLSERLHVLDRRGRIIHAFNRSYTLEVDVDGQADTIVHVAAPPVLKTPDERRELEARINADPRLGGGHSLDPEKPIIAELKLDQDDRIWVRLRTEAEELDRPGFRWRETQRLWHVWEPDGTPVGVVRLRLGVHWMEARGDHLWVATLGEMGAIQIIQYRMVTG